LFVLLGSIARRAKQPLPEGDRQKAPACPPPGDNNEVFGPYGERCPLWCPPFPLCVRPHRGTTFCPVFPLRVIPLPVLPLKGKNKGFRPPYEESPLKGNIGTPGDGQKAFPWDGIVSPSVRPLRDERKGFFLEFWSPLSPVLSVLSPYSSSP